MFVTLMRAIFVLFFFNKNHFYECFNSPLVFAFIKIRHRYKRHVKAIRLSGVVRNENIL